MIFLRCGLPYYIGGIIDDRISYFFKLLNHLDNDLMLMSELGQVTQINPNKSNHKNYRGEVYTETYDKLLMSPGAFPFLLNFKVLKMKEFSHFAMLPIQMQSKVYRY